MRPFSPFFPKRNFKELGMNLMQYQALPSEFWRKFRPKQGRGPAHQPHGKAKLQTWPDGLTHSWGLDLQLRTGSLQVLQAFLSRQHRSKRGIIQPWEMQLWVQGIFNLTQKGTGEEGKKKKKKICSKIWMHGGLTVGRNFSAWGWPKDTFTAQSTCHLPVQLHFGRGIFPCEQEYIL